MRLHYFKDPAGNFGDDLNPWLFRRLVPQLLDDDDREWLVGIGTLINHRLPAAPVKHVFGSGHGYGQTPKLDDSWVFHAVRGKETARVLGLPESAAVTDGAVLLRTVPLPRAARPGFRFGLVPHCESLHFYDWAPLAAELGWHFIDVRQDVETVLYEMSRCETLVCEAMHGAIVADALRIPWIPVSAYPSISAFKWRDWLSALDLPYEPTALMPLYDLERLVGPGARLKWTIKRGLAQAGLGSSTWTPPPPARTGEREREAALMALRTASARDPLLSADRRIEDLTQEMQARLQRLAAR